MPQVGTADDFSNLKVLQRNLAYRKKELFSFLTQQILARSVKKLRSYSRSKSSGLENNLSPSLREKSRFDGTTGLIFHPDNGSLAYSDKCICTTGGHGRCMQRSTKADLFLLASFSFQLLPALCFWFVWTQRKRNHVLKDHDCYDFLLLSRVQVQLLVDRLRQGHG